MKIQIHHITIITVVMYSVSLAATLKVPSEYPNIQEAINTSNHGDRIEVSPGFYIGEVDFQGKAITIAGIPDKTGAPIIENPGDFAVSCFSGESADSILKNFVIRKSFMAGFIVGSSPTLHNLTIVDNKYGIEAYADANPDIRNCIFWNNEGSHVFGIEAQHSWLSGQMQGSLTDGLIGYWSFNEEDGEIVFDAASNKHGLIHGGASRTDGIYGKALQFDGVDDYVSVPYANDFQLSVFTIAAWIRPDMDLSTTGAVIAGRGEDFATDKAAYLLDVPNPASQFGKGIRLLYEDNSDTERHYSNEYFPPIGVWTHIAASRSSLGRVTLYYNGAVLAQWNDTPTPTTMCKQDFTIGARWWSSTTQGNRLIDFFPGTIDEIRIYNRALSYGEIQSIASMGEPYFVNPRDGDYHLKSQRGRHWPEHNVWVLDEVTSPCIDGGDPDHDFSNEPYPNGGCINMGVYGGTAFASMSGFNQPPELILASPVVTHGNIVQCEIFAWDNDGMIEKVEIYLDGQIAGEDDDPSDGWKFVLHITEPGEHSIMAVAMDNDGKTATSDEAIVSISSGGSMGGR